MAASGKDRVIRDAIHGDIALSRLEVELLDTPAVQRLRHIHQNGLCYLVYPSMTSTRFEHSLGVMHLAGRVASHLNLRPKNAKALRVAGLLHDVGHAPFSHTSDDILAAKNLYHEEQSATLIQADPIAGILKSHKLDAGLVADLVVGGGRLGKLISSEIDVDKMDYLLRDAHYAGVSYGRTDVERIMESVRLANHDIVLESGSLEAVESLLISRGLMHQTVYWHKTKRIAEAMLTAAVSRLIDRRKLAVRRYMRLDDIDLIALLRTSRGYSRDLMRRIDERRLFKLARQAKLAGFTCDEQRILYADKERIQRAIAADHGIRKGYTLLDVPEAKLQEYKTKIEYGGELKRIDEVSTLARSLEAAEEDRYTVNVYAPSEDIDRFKKFDLNDYIG